MVEMRYFKDISEMEKTMIGVFIRVQKINKKNVYKLKHFLLIIP